MHVDQTDHLQETPSAKWPSYVASIVFSQPQVTSSRGPEPGKYVVIAEGSGGGRLAVYLQFPGIHGNLVIQTSRQIADVSHDEPACADAHSEDSPQARKRLDLGVCASQ